LTVEDVKLGRKLDQINRFEKANYSIKDAKMNYYKNLKPKAGAF